VMLLLTMMVLVELGRYSDLQNQNSLHQHQQSHVESSECAIVV